MAHYDMNDDFDPDPPSPPARDYEQIGEFFHEFSIVEEWINEYINRHDRLDDRWVFSEKITRWRRLAKKHQPTNDAIEVLYRSLDELLRYRNTVAHAWWEEDKGRLRGTYESLKGEIITIDSYNDLSSMVDKARFCKAVICFGFSE